jgi:hypothetical protein
MMEPVGYSETSVFFSETTRRYIPVGYHLHTYIRRLENLKSSIRNTQYKLARICSESGSNEQELLSLPGPGAMALVAPTLIRAWNKSYRRKINSLTAFKTIK